MANEWRTSTWGDEISLEYGKALRGYDETQGTYRVFGANGPIGWTSEPLAQGPGVILGRKGAYRGVEFSRDPFFVIDTAYYVVPKTELDMRWLYYAIKHYKLGSVDDGSPIPSTTRAAVYVLNVAVPPIEEQRAIAAVLGAFDDKIEVNRRINAALEGMARALFKSWFVDCDPVLSKADGSEPALPQPMAGLFPDSFEPSGVDIPTGWKAVGLDKIGRFLNGLALQKFPAVGDRYLPVIKIAQLRTEDTSDADRASADLPSDYVVEDGDVLFSWSGSLECVLWAGGRGALNQHLFKVTSQDYPKWFSFLWIRHHLPEFRHIASGKATTMGHIQRGHLAAARVLVPPPAVLKSMDQYFAPFIDQIVNLKLASRTLAAMRDALSPRLLSGELRVPDAERIVGGHV